MTWIDVSICMRPAPQPWACSDAMMAADWLSIGIVSARWFHAAPGGKNGRVQLLPDAVPESPRTPEDPEELATPEEEPEPDEALEPWEASEPVPPELEDVLALEEPPELEEPFASEPPSEPLDEPPLEASFGPGFAPLPPPLPQATQIRIAAIPAFARVRIP